MWLLLHYQSHQVLSVHQVYIEYHVHWTLGGIGGVDYILRIYKKRSAAARLIARIVQTTACK